MSNKTIFISVLLGVASLSVLGNIAQLKRSKAAQERIELLSRNTSGGMARIVNRYIHDSIEHVVIKEVPVKTKAEKIVAVGGGYLDTLTKALKVAVKQVEEVTQVNAKLKVENLSLRRTASRAEYSDKWLRLSYDLDSDKVSLNYDVSLNVASYWKRSWMLGPKRHYVDIYGEDPRIRIGSVKRYTLAEQVDKRMGIGVAAGYAYTPFSDKLQPYAGLALSYHLFEF